MVRRSLIVSVVAAAATAVWLPGGGVASAAAVGGEVIHATHLEPEALPANLSVVVSGLNQPRRVVIGPNGDLYVTEAGLNTPPAGCVEGTEPACANPSGAIAQITPGGTVTTVVSGLPSVPNGSDEPSPGSAGPSGLTIENGSIQFLIQNQNIDSSTGDETYGTGGSLLGDLASVPLGGGTASSATVEAQLGPYEAKYNPDHGAGAVDGEPAIDSDPYDVLAYDGGYAIADAAANDILLYKNGTLSTLAVLPLITASGGTSQAVPTSLAIGPDGNLYIGELGGVEGGNDVGDANVYELVDGQLVTVASGLTMIGDIAFDQAGRLLVLEMDVNGLLDPDTGGGPGNGELIRFNSDGSRTVLASQGLIFPSGLAVAADGSIYLTNLSVIQAQNDPYLPQASGEIVRVADTTPADEIGANYGGYRLVAADGGVFTFGSYGFYGSLGGVNLKEPIVASSQTPLGPGYWQVASDGGVFSFGTAVFHGSLGGVTLVKPIVTMAPTPDGKGYFLFAADGGVFTFGDAVFHGSLGGTTLRQPIVSGSATPDGGGYDLFAADGGVFTFGDAVFHGSLGGTTLRQPIVSGEVTPDNAGYRMVASDGGVFNFGDAVDYGSLGGTTLRQPIVDFG